VTEILFRELAPEAIPALRHDPVDEATIAQAATIVGAVRREGEAALRRYAEQWDGLTPGAPLLLTRAQLEGAWCQLAEADRALLERTAARIRAFAEAQRASIRDMTTHIPGGTAGQHVVPVERAGCYAPGGRFPLPSSVLMTAITARVAGVREVIVASPRPSIVTQAAAYAAGADALLVAGGAQAIAALAHGAGPVPACDVIVGPGNRWVTAAKFLVSAHVAIDMLAGPSELVILATEAADPVTVAADLLAQAEHDPDALPVLVTTHRPLIEATRAELARQLETLPTRATAEPALRNGFAVCAAGEAEAIAVVDKLAPEHLQILAEPTHAHALARRIAHYGAVFIGNAAAEVLGDYGAGPNHTLPTGGRARYTGGLSVFHFLRIRTWMQVDDLAAAQDLVADSVALGRHEGLEAHARAAERRLLGR
jgi:phosphoribosyl-ATP pyrophosphohydrolase/phosphoribosyl-AMP cyclohydrolase/histidinol dehydrogenase